MNDYVTRSGSRLMLAGQPFRFSGPNIYWLGLDENVDGVQYPSEFRVRNVLDTAAEMGATAVRAHTLAASHGGEKALMSAPGQYNEEALRRIDHTVAYARSKGLRLMIPFVDNWSYYHGGRATFAGWLELADADAFYSHPGAIAEFKAYIAMFLLRINTVTGIPYREEPAILAWELGNELNHAPAKWVQDMACFIKSIDGNHLIAHGKQFGLDADKLSIPELDILDVHYYPGDIEGMVRDAHRTAACGKAYIAGEYDWQSLDMADFARTVEAEPSIAGTFFWSLFGHHDEGGYVEHYDGFSLHYPGLDRSAELAGRIQRLRSHAYAVSGRKTPPALVPEAPLIRSAGPELVFRGAAGAAFYTLERSVTGPTGPWAVVYDKRPADHSRSWTDPGRDLGKAAWYRVKAHSVTGEAGAYSPVFQAAAHSRE